LVAIWTDNASQKMQRNRIGSSKKQCLIILEGRPILAGREYAAKAI